MTLVIIRRGMRQSAKRGKSEAESLNESEKVQMESRQSRVDDLTPILEAQ